MMFPTQGGWMAGASAVTLTVLADHGLTLRLVVSGRGVRGALFPHDSKTARHRSARGFATRKKERAFRVNEILPEAGDAL